MQLNIEEYDFYVRPGVTDMRKRVCLVKMNSTKLSCRIPHFYRDDRKGGEDSYTRLLRRGFLFSQVCRQASNQ